MKRLLLTIVCCSSLLFLPLSAFSLTLTGPTEEDFAASYVQYGPISGAETLWGIARVVRPDNSVSIQQTLVAIYKLNPDVFRQGNINRIIAGSLIEVPSLDFIQQQTAREASALINKYSTAQKTPVKKVQPKKQPVAVVVKKQVAKKTVVKEPVVEKPSAEKVATAAKDLVENNQATALDTELKALQKEFANINEQLIVETENNQILKVKLQPLHDEIADLKEQLANQRDIDAQLQQQLDDYIAQLDAVKARPFSGEGLFNQLLRTITSSLTNLLIAIISPVLLLLMLLVVIMRVSAKRKLAQQEQEIAESTAALMEEPGKFDSLLTEGIVDEAPEVDFASDEMAEEEITAATAEKEPATAEGEENFIDLTDEAIEEDEDEDDPFGISSLVDDEDLSGIAEASAKEEDKAEDDDPFGIGALADEIETDEDDPFGIAALANELPDEADDDDDPFGLGALEDELPAETDEDDPFAITALADDALDNSDTDEEDPFAINGSTDDAADDIETGQDDPFGLSTPAEDDSLIASVSSDETDPISAEEQANLDLAAEWESQLSSDETQSPEAEELIDKQDTFDLEEQEQSDGALFDEDIDLPASQIPPGGEDVSDEELDDLLAKQLSDVAFNSDVPLPKVDKADKNDFIDIDTLLENSEEQSTEEPYSELDLDLGLDDFPDVINASDDAASDAENEISTQLDLARAYLEIDDKAGAKDILLSILETSEGAQKAEIEKLLSRIG